MQPRTAEGPMTGRQFKAELRSLGLSQAALQRIIVRLGGPGFSKITIYRWCRSREPVPPIAATLVRLLKFLPSSRVAMLRDGL